MTTPPAIVSKTAWTSKKHHAYVLDDVVQAYDPAPFQHMGIVGNPQERVYVFKRLQTPRHNLKVAQKQREFLAQQLEDVSTERPWGRLAEKSQQEIEQGQTQLRLEEREAGADPLALSRIRGELRCLELFKGSDDRIKKLHRGCEQLRIGIDAHQSRLRRPKELRRAAESQGSTSIQQIEGELRVRGPPWVTLQLQTPPDVNPAVVRAVHAKRQRALADQYRRQKEFQMMGDKLISDGQLTEGEVYTQYEYAKLMLEKMHKPEETPVEEANWEVETRKWEDQRERGLSKFAQKKAKAKSEKIARRLEQSGASEVVAPRVPGKVVQKSSSSSKESPRERLQSIDLSPVRSIVSQLPKEQVAVESYDPDAPDVWETIQKSLGEEFLLNLDFPGKSVDDAYHNYTTGPPKYSDSESDDWDPNAQYSDEKQAIKWQCWEKSKERRELRLIQSQKEEPIQCGVIGNEGVNSEPVSGSSAPAPLSCGVREVGEEKRRVPQRDDHNGAGVVPAEVARDLDGNGGVQDEEGC